jgi:hypothetical protein
MARKHPAEFFPNRLFRNASWPLPGRRFGIRFAGNLPLNHLSTP